MSLTCEHCKREIEDTEAAYLAWSNSKREGPVRTLMLVHHGRCDDISRLFYSTGLEDAVRLALDLDYDWTAPQLRKLVAVALAVGKRAWGQ